ncbi:MAG: hypothetical protein DMG42_34510 [Acidobacteria bacterium]|nr:MAG: hypothetical protein DMG42_34510 [Acidobacteriota bacterium]
MKYWSGSQVLPLESVKEEVAPALMRTDGAPACARLLPIEIKKRINVTQDTRVDFLAFNKHVQGVFWRT